MPITEWSITFFEKGFDAGNEHGIIKSEKVRVMRLDGSLVKIPGIGDQKQWTWLKKDGRRTKPLPGKLRSVNNLELLFLTIPAGGEAFQELSWNGEIQEKVHYDNFEDVHIDNG